MDVDRYQEFTKETAIYPEVDTGSIGEFSYLALGLVGESGEVAEKVKKRIRDGTFDKENFIKELGDVYWYLGRLCDACGVQSSEVLETNYLKLMDRKIRHKLGGSGDNR